MEELTRYDYNAKPKPKDDSIEAQVLFATYVTLDDRHLDRVRVALVVARVVGGASMKGEHKPTPAEDGLAAFLGQVVTPEALAAGLEDVAIPAGARKALVEIYAADRQIAGSTLTPTQRRLLVEIPIATHQARMEHYVAPAPQLVPGLQPTGA